MGIGLLYIFSLRLLDHFWWLLGVVFMVEPWLDAHIERYHNWAETYISRQLRARLAWTISIVFLFIAGAWAFSDEYWNHQGDLHALYLAQSDARTHQQRADDLDKSIHGKGGFEDQIQELRNKPPQDMTQAPPAATPQQAPLKRLIAYENPTPIQDCKSQDNKTKFLFDGFAFRLNNVSADTISLKVDFIRAVLNGKEIMNGCTTGWSIVAQTQGISPQCRIIPDGIALSEDNKTISLEFEVSYDTIPVTGIRKSYRKMVYSVNWGNDPSNPPSISIDHIESEKED